MENTTGEMTAKELMRQLGRKKKKAVSRGENETYEVAFSDGFRQSLGPGCCRILPCPRYD